MSSRLTKPTLSSQQKVVPKRPYFSANPTKVASNPRFPKFDWRVNEELGYFELGTLSPDDDFYVFNTTLVSCEYFQLVRSFDRNDLTPILNFYLFISVGRYRA